MNRKFKKDGIIVELVLKSINTVTGDKMMTLRCHYPRIVHAEVKTHSQLKTNSASSRAVPVSAMNKSILDDIAKPIRFGANQSGMQDKGVDHDGLIDVSDTFDFYTGREVWDMAASSAIVYSNALADAGYHKQVCNRITEPFQYMDIVMSGSEWANFFWLRVDPDADPTFVTLAELCLEAYLCDGWDLLYEGDWHLPFVRYSRNESTGKQEFYIVNVDDSDSYTNGYEYKQELTLDQAKLISMSVCAQSSFRKSDYSLEKALAIEPKLFSGNKVHASPSEHQAQAIGNADMECFSFNNIPKGVTHVNIKGEYCSGNLIGWIQLRQLLDNNYQSNMDDVLRNLDKM